MRKRKGMLVALVGSILLAGCLMVGSSWAADTATRGVKNSAEAGREKKPGLAPKAGAAVLGAAQEKTPGRKHTKSSLAAAPAKADEIALLKEQLTQQQKQIEQLRAAVDEQRQMLERALESSRAPSAEGPNLGQVASLAPVIPIAPAAKAVSAGLSYSSSGAQPVGAGGTLTPRAAGGASPVTQDEMKGYTQKVDQLDKAVSVLNKGLAGFKLSGDLRLRSDNIFRSSNDVAGSQQNVRARYRLRFNVDKAVSDQIDTHLQLSSGPFNNGLTYDSDYNGTVTRGSILLSEAWGAYHPNHLLDLRGGKISEAFADNARFLIDDDVRLNGFQEIARSQSTSSSLGKVTFEFRAGQYIFTNPNVQVLASNSAYATDAGYTPGRKVPSTNMFDQGIVVTASPSEHWSHQATVNFELWRNPNSIQLASLASGYALLGNPYNGVTLSGAITGTGNGTTTKGGGIFTADSFHIGQVVYRLDYQGWKSHRQGFPVSLEFHGAKNFGADFYGNALMGQISAGETKKAGDVAFKYGFFYKQANSMISQITDDDVGTGTGVNLRTHMIRFDVGINKFMAWQNMLFIQNELAANDPGRNFYVNLQRGANTQYRYQGQLQFTF
ncbi:MAG: putative porin [Terriglobia bacterium]